MTALAEALLRRRDDYNQRFLRARYLQRRLAPDDFQDVLRRYAAPVAEGLAERTSSDAELDTIVSALYDLCLQLTAQDLLGSRARVPVLAELFDELLPCLAGLIAEQPERVLVALCNAAYNLALEPAADPRCWIARLVALAPRLASVDALLLAGQVAAWRCGMAHYRESALQAARQLEPDLLAALVDQPQIQNEPQSEAQNEKAAERLLAALSDPWFDPAARVGEKRLQRVGRVGGFVGFDGPFIEPPEVTRFGERIYALDSQQAWLLFADRFGQVLKGQGSDLPAGAPDDSTHFDIDTDGRVSCGKHRARFPELAGWRSAASTEHSLVVTLPHSHYLFLVALR
ncbi:hypothetical protein [Thiorhodovibrio frisius]|uniref:Uncharacterized protein n=1 Tax=Thiorhodovibrio frisius TaxID=631362 RepID=H8Z4T5_9GAMM|nr:hypothetical protein [Thiorhodovibrio frisius]EIC20342.1 hypothetical protein Thi970DRAFT_03969 [Thiorhodovibrio frisius]WPL21080.1 hypothetical protein Thiofri_01188 [Thiorhodovibrio frisius]